MTPYTQEEKQKFANIIFNNDINPQTLASTLTQQQTQKLLEIYAQKLANQGANDPQIPPRLEQLRQPSQEQIRNPIKSVFFCFFPELHRDKFQITTSIFLKRVTSVFLFWKNDWFKIAQKQQLYGWLWFNFTFIVAIGIVTHLNSFKKHQQSQQYQLDSGLLRIAYALTYLFSLVMPYIYRSVIKCLSGYIQLMQVYSVYGYSLIFVIIPTVACFITEIYWQIIILGLGAFLKAIFLFRNYSSKLDSKYVGLLAALLIIEAFYILLIIRIFFKVPVSKQKQKNQTSPQTEKQPTKQKEREHYLHLRFFDI